MALEDVEPVGFAGIVRRTEQNISAIAALSKASEKEEAEAQQAAGDDDEDAFPYQLVLHNGVICDVVSKLEPNELSGLWQRARKADDVMFWEDGSSTEARQIAHIRLPDEEEQEEEKKTEAAAAAS